MFENHPKCRTSNFPPIFVLQNYLSGNTVWPQASGFQKLAKIDYFGIFNELLSTQTVNVASFARNVEWDFFCDFQTLWRCLTILFLVKQKKEALFAEFLRKRLRYFSQIIPLLIKVALKHLVYMWKALKVNYMYIDNSIRIHID